MKKLRFLIMALAGMAALGIYSCENIAMDDISVTPSEITLTAGNTNSTRTVVVNMGEGFSWDVTSTAPWITVTSKTAGGFTMSIAPYITGTTADVARQGIVVVTSNRGDYPVVITQDRYTGYDITVPASLPATPAAGDTQNVTINGNLPWEAVVIDDATGEPATWVHLTPTSGQSGDTMEVVIDQNLGAGRTATITVKNEYNESTILVNQGLATALVATPDVIDFDAQEVASKTSTIVGDPQSAAPVLSAGLADWVTVNLADGVLTVTTISANPATTPRTGTITLSNGVTPDCVVTVNQAGLDGTLTVTPSTAISFTAEDATTRTLTVTSLLAWTTTKVAVSPADASWLTVTASGGPNGTITVSVTRNDTADQRSATFTVTNGANTSAPIAVNQAGLDPAIIVVTEAAFNGIIPAAGLTGQLAYTFTSKLPLTKTALVSESPNGDTSWLAVGTLTQSGAETYTVNVAVTRNYTATPRIAHFDVTNGTNTETLTIQQAAAVDTGVPTLDINLMNFDNTGVGNNPTPAYIVVTSETMPTFVQVDDADADPDPVATATLVSSTGNQHTFQISLGANNNGIAIDTKGLFKNTVGDSANFNIKQDA